MRKNIDIAIKNYFSRNKVKPAGLNFALFDMDGVLYDSMPAHAKAWKETIAEKGVHSTLEEFYEYEGQTAKTTLNIIFNREFGRDVHDYELTEIYKRKTELFVKYNEGNLIPNIKDVLIALKNIKKTIVTGSSQPSLIDKINKNFIGFFDLNAMVTGKDVHLGKPDPEPYIKAMDKLNALKHETIVIENAPMGIKSAVASGAFTIAVNTGIIKNEVLEQYNPDILYNNMSELSRDIPYIIKAFSK